MTGSATTIPLSGMRGMIADHMVRSLATAAQLTHHASADVSQLLLEKNRLAEAGCHFSVEDFLLIAVIRALKQHPQVNGHINEHEIKLFDRIDLSIAISLPDNLLAAPAMFGVEALDIVELNAARKDLIARARSNKVSVKEMNGGTFTVSNLGLTRVESFTPIIKLPQICVLGIGCMTERAVRTQVDDIEWRTYTGLSLTFDHRAIDGAPAGLFLTTVCKEIEAIGATPLLNTK